MTRERREEKIAKLVVEFAMPGVKMCFRQNQSSGGHDFDLHLPIGEIAALEVTTSTDQTLMSTVAAIERRGMFVPTKKCKKDWYVHPMRHAAINEIRSRVDEYLAGVEATGLDRFFGPTDCLRYLAVDQIYRDQAIEAGAVTAWKMPGQIGISSPSEGEFAESQFAGENVQDAVRAEASKPDNRKKLAKSGCAERHLFLYVHLRNYPVWKSLVDEHPPAVLAELPNEISHIWVASESRLPDHVVVWRATADTGWLQPEEFPIQAPPI